MKAGDGVRRWKPCRDADGWQKLLYAQDVMLASLERERENAIMSSGERRAAEPDTVQSGADDSYS